MWECVWYCVCGYAYKYNDFLLAKILLPLTDMIISCMSLSLPLYLALPCLLSLAFALS